ncbi:hypothetical protein C3F09_09535 [candidate division GN15 bacterium]|uniref:Phosphatidic acid phosphatase type 2/haloperoxidase domain-containing protein n=1 Tax=candidate division GN15 bacterium TaxID=2072418 RepID=A0A855WXQ5_9BACT|nr:MAG: hypothetical protein C3F09_09535 [candidate division GN15 bacterium]
MAQFTYRDVRSDRDLSVAPPRHWWDWIFRLRIEEFLALVFFAPMVYLTLKAFFFYYSQGIYYRKFVGDVERACAVVIVAALAIWIAKYRPRWTVLRDALPFAYCVAIYTNLHDTIHFANPHDIHNALIAFDGWLFGVQPCIWAQQFVRPWLTEILSLCYMSFFIWSPLVASVLYFRKRKTEFRYTMASVILCFYFGYILYVLFPAVPPRIMLQHQLTAQFNGTPIADAALKVVNTLPGDSRAAFPSLHAAITLLSVLFAWKYLRTLFWVILPFCVGLWVSTIYLCHHYFLDLVAGFILGILAFVYGPRIEAWWQSRRPVGP